jgi:toxin-antitoxin system PIN domain toxin
MTPDLNVLVAASSSVHPHHRAALGWLKGAIASCADGAVLLVLPMIAAGFLRVVTHPKIFIHPTPVDDAISFIETLLRVPGAEMPELATEWASLCHLCREGRLAGNEIPDAWIAAAILARGDHLVTFDKGFAHLLPRRAFTLLQPGN